MHKVFHVHGTDMSASLEYLVSKRDKMGVNVLARVVTQGTKLKDEDDVAGVAEGAYWGAFQVRPDVFSGVEFKFILPDVEQDNVWYVHFKIVSNASDVIS